MKVLLDSDVILGLRHSRRLAKVVEDIVPHFCTHSRIRVLGEESLLAPEAAALRALLDTMVEIELDHSVIEQAILLRQLHNLNLGDSIMASTAIVHGLELWTTGGGDFPPISGLHVHDPLAE